MEILQMACHHRCSLQAPFQISAFAESSMIDFHNQRAVNDAGEAAR
jgi:hypothetical protein